jgi:hypothetical protein
MDAKYEPDRMRDLKVVVASRAEEAGMLALADIAALAEHSDINYRVVGGQMVSLLVALSGVEDPELRQTLDADLGVTPKVAGDPSLVIALKTLGYDRPDVANRFIRKIDDEQSVVIDLLMPSYQQKMNPNQRQGDMILDAIPGLSLALARQGLSVKVHAELLDGMEIDFITVLPDIGAALCLKALGYADRMARKDAMDVWRLLEAYVVEFPRGEAWPSNGSLGDAVRVLRESFGRPSGAGLKQASSSSQDRARIRALVLRAVGQEG